jgi:hypothetical protein
MIARADPGFDATIPLFSYVIEIKNEFSTMYGALINSVGFKCGDLYCTALYEKPPQIECTAKQKNNSINLFATYQKI